MVRFLRLFSLFRDLETAVDKESARAALLADQNREHIATIAELRAQLAASREELLGVLKEQLQPRGNATGMQAVPPRSIHGRDLVRLKTQEFYEEEKRQAAQQSDFNAQLYRNQ